MKDEQVLQELGIMRKSEEKAEPKASYDRIVMLVLESVHRDYMHYYNENIPAEATPYLDSCLKNTRTLTTTILRQCYNAGA